MDNKTKILLVDDEEPIRAFLMRGLEVGRIQVAARATGVARAAITEATAEGRVWVTSG